MKKIYRFTASWCQPCKGLAMVLENAELGIPIEVIDIDVHPELTQEYKVRSVPTLVLLEDDAEVARMTGMSTADAIKEWAGV